MLKLVTCLTATCDHCREPAGEEDHGVPVHFADEAEIREFLSRWRFLAGGRLLCDRCAARRDCGVHGHHWSPWQPCRCDGQLPVHRVPEGQVCGVEVRFCDRCGEPDERPANGTPTASASSTSGTASGPRSTTGEEG